ncbi:MAG: acylphosphatase [Kineosporiaceae bacterium]
MTAALPDPADEVVQLTALVRGRVQGVGFRWWTRSRALELGLVGRAANLDDGRVEVLVQGPRVACEVLLHLLSVQPAPQVPANAPRSYYRRPGHVDSVTARWSEADLPLTGFVER